MIITTVFTEINDLISIITSKRFKISRNKTYYQTNQPKVRNIIVMNNNIRLSDAYKKKTEGFDDKEALQVIYVL